MSDDTTADPPPAPLVRVTVERGVATLTLDSPHNRNALSRALVTQLRDGLAAALDDPGLRAVVLTHAGPVFCSGADLAEQGQPPRAGAGRLPAVPEVMAALTDAPVPVVAVLRGPARAGGIGLVAACDVALADPAVSFAFTEVHIGVVPAMIAVPVLARMTPRAVSRYMLSGEVFSAAEAVTAGLLTAAPDDLTAALDTLLAGFRRAEPGALATTKGILVDLRRLEPDRDAAYALAADVSARFFASETAQEGMAAFRERRPPRWVV